MTNIVPYKTPARKTGRELRRIEQEAIVRRATLEDAANTKQAELAIEDRLAAYQADRRIENGYNLASRAVGQATRLNREVTQQTQDNPGLEMSLRQVEETVIMGATRLIYGYMTR